MVNLIPVDNVQQEQMMRVLERTQSYENFVSLLKAADLMWDRTGSERTQFDVAFSRRFKCVAAQHFKKKPFFEIEQTVDGCLSPGYLYSPLMELLLEMAPTAAKYLECARKYPSDSGSVVAFHREVRATLGHFFSLNPSEEQMLELLHGFCMRWDRWGSHCYDPPRRQYYLSESGRLELMRLMVKRFKSPDTYLRWVTGGGCELPWDAAPSDEKRQFIRETLCEYLKIEGSARFLPVLKSQFVGDASDRQAEWDKLACDAADAENARA